MKRISASGRLAGLAIGALLASGPITEAAAQASAPPTVTLQPAPSSRSGKFLLGKFTYSRTQADQVNLDDRYAVAYITYNRTSTAPIALPYSTLDRFKALFINKKSSFTVVADVYAKMADTGKLVKIQTLPVASFSYDSRTMTLKDGADFLNATPVTPRIPIRRLDDIQISLRAVYTNQASLDYTPVMDLARSSGSLFTEGWVLSQVADNAVTASALQFASSLYARWGSFSKEGEYAWHLKPGGDDRVVIELFDNAASFGSITVDVGTRCSALQRTAECDFPKIAENLDLDTVFVWNGETLQSVIAAPREPTEISNQSSAPTRAEKESLKATCDGLRRQLTNQIGLTRSDAATVAFRFFSRRGFFANPAYAQSECYSDWSGTWSALGLTPPDHQARRILDLPKATIEQIARQLKVLLTVDERDADFTQQLARAFVSTGRVDVEIAPDLVSDGRLQTSSFTASELSELLKRWRIETPAGCTIADASDRKPEADQSVYRARLIVRGKRLGNGTWQGDGRLLLVELTINHRLAIGEDPSISRLSIRPVTSEDDWAVNRGTCKLREYSPAPPAQTPNSTPLRTGADGA